MLQANQVHPANRMITGRHDDASGTGIGSARAVLVTGAGNVTVARAADNHAVVRQALASTGMEVCSVPCGPAVLHALATSDAAIAVPVALGLHPDDGGVADLLELAGMEFVGAPAGAVRTTDDKAHLGQVLCTAGVPTPPLVVLSREYVRVGAARPALHAAWERLGPTLVVKPRRGIGGSGVRIVTSAGDAANAVTAALNYNGSSVGVQRFVAGTEMTVLVRGEAEAPAIVGVVRVDSKHPAREPAALWDRTPVPLSPERVPVTASESALAAYRALGCRDVATVDLVVDRTGTAWVFDVDTAVDWSTDGFARTCAASGGTTAEALIVDLVREALKRRARRLS